MNGTSTRTNPTITTAAASATTSTHTRIVAALLLLLLALLYVGGGGHAAPANVLTDAQKLKYKQKEYKQKEKRFEPVVRERVADYAGRYLGIEPDYYLVFETDAGGALTAVSHEGARRAVLRDIRIEGARLTATRVYPDGATKDFAATFVNRILNGVSAFGIVVENLDVHYEGITLNRIFYRLARTP